jgi:PhnB protein
MPQTVTPYLYYEDPGAALDWLTRAFGFREVDRTTGGASGMHAELTVGESGRLFLGGPMPSPKSGGARTADVYAYVDDVDAAFSRALECGATAVEEPGDQAYGERRCGVADPEGHHWWLAAPIAS